MSEEGGYIDLTGGGSVYCINENQMREARRLAREDSESGPRIAAALGHVKHALTRNEQAALAFVLIEELLQSHSSGAAV